MEFSKILNFAGRFCVLCLYFYALQANCQNPILPFHFKSYVDTEPMHSLERTLSGSIGGQSRLVASQVNSSTKNSWQFCTDFFRFDAAFVKQYNGTLPLYSLPHNTCRGRKLRVVFVMDNELDILGHFSKLWESEKLRGLAILAEMQRRGHHVVIADRSNIRALDLAHLDVAVFVKHFSKDVVSQVFKNTSFPLVLDLVDLDVPPSVLAEFFDFALVNHRMQKVFFDQHGLPSFVNYHQQNNYAGLARTDRSSKVKVITMQGLITGQDKDIAELSTFLRSYCQEYNMSFRTGSYTGKGWDVEDFKQIVRKPAMTDLSNEIRWYMGMRETDVAILWPREHTGHFVCQKPIFRFVFMLSLGIPTITFPIMSYLDLIVAHGYPLVASNLDEVKFLLDLLRSSPEFRQQASSIGLKLAHQFNLQRTVDSYADSLCQIVYSHNSEQS